MPSPPELIMFLQKSKGKEPHSRRKVRDMNADLREENAWKYYKYAEIMEGIVPLSPTSTIPALLLTLFSMFLVLYTKSFPSQHGTETDTMYT